MMNTFGEERTSTRTAVVPRQVGGIGVMDYSGRQPNHESLGDMVCKSDPKPGFSFVLNNFAELLDDTFLQNLTSTICQGKPTHRGDQFGARSLCSDPRLTGCFCLVQIRGAPTTNAPVSLFLLKLRCSSDSSSPPVTPFLSLLTRRPSQSKPR